MCVDPILWPGVFEDRHAKQKRCFPKHPSSPLYSVVHFRDVQTVGEADWTLQVFASHNLDLCCLLNAGAWHSCNGFPVQARQVHDHQNKRRSQCGRYLKGQCGSVATLTNTRCRPVQLPGSIRLKLCWRLNICTGGWNLKCCSSGVTSASCSCFLHNPSSDVENRNYTCHDSTHSATSLSLTQRLIRLNKRSTGQLQVLS